MSAKGASEGLKRVLRVLAERVEKACERCGGGLLQPSCPWPGHAIAADLRALAGPERPPDPAEARRRVLERNP